MPSGQMGNVCGCVRAEKEEQYFDPAKSPLSPEKHSPGRKYFRRKPCQEVVGDTEPVRRSSEREGKKGGCQPAGGQPAVSSRGLVPEDPAASPTWEDDVQPKTAAADRGGEQKPLASAVDSCSYRATVPSVGSRGSEVQVSAPDKTVSEDSRLPCTERKRHPDDVGTKQGTFQRKNDVSLFQKAASLNSVLCATEKSLENRVFVGNLSKSCGSVQEQYSTEGVHPQATHHLQFTQRRCHSLCASLSSAPKGSPGKGVSETSVQERATFSHHARVAAFVFLKCRLHTSL